MNKRRIIAVIIAFVLTIAATAMWSASSIDREGDPDANVLEDSGSEAGVATEAKKSGGGNKVVKVLKAPFKMFGRLFGRGGDDHKFKRMTEEDADLRVWVLNASMSTATTKRTRRSLDQPRNILKVAGST
jgi:hypothetical protein